MDLENGPVWPEEVHFGLFRSANCTLAILLGKETAQRNELRALVAQ